MDRRYNIVLVMVLAWLTACNKRGEKNVSINTSKDTVVATNMPGIYSDPTTGLVTPLYKDEQTGYVLDARSGEPLEFYVDMNTMDTFYGRTGTIVNNAITRTTEGLYRLDESKVRWNNDTMKIVAGGTTQQESAITDDQDALVNTNSINTKLKNTEEK